ncbi:hypothetical protein BKA70DRAFT_1087943 [Coprinopsis sp. MPI-PUGE-AT-0042]|nr:hypothetical protein BKA70DRAFT_1087943 [Coprinopsis sp. MPI-PUGE-AT-0042]
MYICMPYILSIDEPSIIFIPPPDEQELADGHAAREPFAMQVTVKQAGKRHLEELIVYFAVQHEITKAIETIVSYEAKGSHVPSIVEIEGEGLEGRVRTKFLLRGGMALTGHAQTRCLCAPLFSSRLLSR